MVNEKNSRTFYAIKNVIFNFGYQFVNVITNLIVPRLIIQNYGSIVNGLISTIKQIINYIQIVGAGISESTVVSLYKPLATNDEKKVSSIYKACEKTFNIAGIIFSIISVVIAFVYPVFINEHLTYFFIVKIILVLSVMGASEFFMIGKCRALLTADQKVYVINIAQTIGSIVSTIVTIVMINLKTSIIIVQIAAMITYVLRIIILWLYVRNNYAYLDKTAVPDLTAVAKRKDATIHQIASLIIFGSQTILISKFCGLAEASVYSVYAMIFTGINTVLSTISSAMLAGMGNLMATDDGEKVKKVYSIYEFLYYILVFTCYITAYIVIVPFINLYIGQSTDICYIRLDVIVLFTIMGLLNCLRTPGATIINAKGYYKETKNRAIMEMTICLFGEVLLVGKLGIIGVLLGTIFAYLYRTLDVIIYSNIKLLQQKPSKTFTRIITNTIIMVIMIVIFKIPNTMTGYMQWVLYAIVITSIAILTTTTINIITNMKTANDTKQYIKNIFKRKKKNVRNN